MTWTLKLNGIYKQYWFINNKCLQIGKLLDIFWKPTVLRKKISTDSWNHSSVNAKRNFCCIITSKNYCNQIFFSPSLISIQICCIVSVSKHSLQSFYERIEMKEDFQIIQYKLMIPIFFSTIKTLLKLSNAIYNSILNIKDTNQNSLAW